MIEPLLSAKVRGVELVDDRRGLNGILPAVADGSAVGGHPGALRSAHDLRGPLQPVAASPSLSADIGSGVSIGLKLTAGQARGGRNAADMPDTLGDGDVLLADRAYDSDARWIEMAARGASSSASSTRSDTSAFSPTHLDPHLAAT